MRRALIALIPALLACPSVPDDDDATEEPTPEPEPSACDVLERAARPWSDGPYGTTRKTLAEDFTLDLEEEDDWIFSEQWSGCESYVFIPDTLRYSANDPTPLWERADDLRGLIDRSPDGVHYFFVSFASSSDDEDAMTKPLRERLDDVLAELATEDADRAAWFADRLHVVRKRRTSLDNWVEDVLGTHGRGGFGIDLFQRVRGVGSYADVVRYDAGLEGWPWADNLAYAAHEAQYFDFEAQRQERLAAQDDAGQVTVLPVWEGEILAEYADAEVTFPSAADMAMLDSLEIDVVASCPDETSAEFNNCGAWDYLAHVWLLDVDGETWLEMARFITPYHREATYILDATQALPWLADGGVRTIRYSFAPSWNTQPTFTEFSFRLGALEREERPTETHYLFGGGGFGGTYNDGRDPIDVAIPATATKVEVRAIITGHGMDAGNCAEFCNHQHEWTVGDEVVLHEHTVVGNQEGCAQAIGSGVVPNQGGTWWFGRGGWCPGQRVDPMVIDATEHVSGGTLTVGYRGLLNGSTPPDGSGNIVMNSWVVVYE